MRIAHVLMGRCNPESANGIDKTVYYLSQAQVALGHSVALFSVTEKPPIPISGVEVRTYASKVPHLLRRLPWLGDLLVRSPWALPKALANELLYWEPNIVHFHFVHIGLHVSLAERLRVMGVPYCVTPHGGLAVRSQRRRKLLKKIFAALYERCYLGHAVFIHAVSSIDAEGLKAYGVRNRIVMAPNGIDLSSIPSKVDGALLKQKFPQLEGRRVLLFLGRLDPEQKGLDILLQGLTQVGDIPVALMLVGPDWRGGRGRLESLVQEFDLAERVVFAGPAFGEEKWNFLAGVDAFVHPSRWEAGVPFSVLEAMAVSRPCLVTPVADPEGRLELSGACIVVQPQPSDIAKGIHRIAEMSAEELHELGRRARALVEKDFHWENIARTLVEAYAKHT